MPIPVIGILSKVDSSNLWVAVAACVPIGAALIAIRFAVNAKRPRLAPSLPTVQVVKEFYLDSCNEPGEAIAGLLGQWNLACVDMKLVNEEKAKDLLQANRFYYWAIALLGFPLFASIVAGALPWFLSRL